MGDDRKKPAFMDKWNPPVGIMSECFIGDQVRLAIGVYLTVKDIKPMTLESGAQTIYWEEDFSSITYHEDGTAWAGGDKYIGNIVEIKRRAICPTS